MTSSSTIPATTSYFNLRSALDASGYGDVLPLDGLPLVERLFKDLQSVKEELSKWKGDSEYYRGLSSNLSTTFTPFQQENIRLIRENSQLRMAVVKLEEQCQDRELALSNRIQELQEEKSDLQILVSHLRKKLGKVFGKESGDSNMIDSCQYCLRLSNLAKHDVDRDRVAADYFQISSSRLAALQLQIRTLKTAEKDLGQEISQLQKKVQNRDREIEKLRKHVGVGVHGIQETNDQHDLELKLKSAEMQLDLLQRRNVELERKLRGTILHEHKVYGTCTKFRRMALLDEFPTHEDLTLRDKLQQLEIQLSNCCKEKAGLKAELDRYKLRLRRVMTVKKPQEEQKESEVKDKEEIVSLDVESGKKTVGFVKGTSKPKTDQQMTRISSVISSKSKDSSQRVTRTEDTAAATSDAKKKKAAFIASKQSSTRSRSLPPNAPETRAAASNNNNKPGQIATLDKEAILDNLERPDNRKLMEMEDEYFSDAHKHQPAEAVTENAEVVDVKDKADEQQPRRIRPTFSKQKHKSASDTAIHISTQKQTSPGSTDRRKEASSLSPYKKRSSPSSKPTMAELAISSLENVEEQSGSSSDEAIDEENNNNDGFIGIGVESRTASKSVTKNPVEMGAARMAEDSRRIVGVTDLDRGSQQHLSQSVKRMLQSKEEGELERFNPTSKQGFATTSNVAQQRESLLSSDLLTRELHQKESLISKLQQQLELKSNEISRLTLALRNAEYHPTSRQPQQVERQLESEISRLKSLLSNAVRESDHLKSELESKDQKIVRLNQEIQDISKSARQRSDQPLFRLDHITANRHREFEDEIGRLRSSVSRLDRTNDTMRSELDRKDEKLARLSQENDKNLQELSRLQLALKNAEYKLGATGESSREYDRQLEFFKRQIETLRKDLERANTERDEVLRDAKRIAGAMNKEESERKGLLVEVEKKDREIDELRKQVGRYVAEVRSIEEVLQSKDDELSNLLSQLQSLTSEKSSLESQRESLERQASTIREDVRETVDLNITLRNQLTSQNSLITSYEQEIEQLTQSLASLETQLGTLKEQNKSLELDAKAARDMLYTMDTKMDKLRYDLAQVQAEKDELSSTNLDLQTHIDVLETQLQAQIEKTKQLEQALTGLREQEIAVHERNVQDLNTERTELEEKLKSLQLKAESLSEQVSKHRLEKLEVQNELEKAKRQLQVEKTGKDAARADLRKLEDRLNNASASSSSVLNAAYLSGSTSSPAEGTTPRNVTVSQDRSSLPFSPLSDSYLNTGIRAEEDTSVQQQYRQPSLGDSSLGAINPPTTRTS